MHRMVFSPEKLRRQRELKGMSRTKVAERAYCTNVAYDAWEDGKEVPGEFWQERLAQALGCQVGDLAKRWRKKDA